MIYLFLFEGKLNSPSSIADVHVYCRGFEFNSAQHQILHFHLVNRCSVLVRMNHPPVQHGSCAETVLLSSQTGSRLNRHIQSSSDNYDSFIRVVYIFDIGSSEA